MPAMKRLLLSLVIAVAAAPLAAQQPVTFPPEPEYPGNDAPPARQRGVLRDIGNLSALPALDRLPLPDGEAIPPFLKGWRNAGNAGVTWVPAGFQTHPAAPRVWFRTDSATPMSRFRFPQDDWPKWVKWLAGRAGR